MKKKIILIVSLICLVSCLACAGIMSFANYDDSKNNSVTIIYKGFSTPYIHYKVGNGEWTNLPGQKMQESSTIEGFPFEYTIDLGSADSATVCFNDGNNNWDSNYMSNYTFYAGTYTFFDGKIQSYPNNIVIKPNFDNIKACYLASTVGFEIYGGKAPYSVEYKISTPNTNKPYTYNNNVTLYNNTYSQSVYCGLGGEASMYVKVIDADGKVAQITKTYDVPKFTVTNIVPSVSSPQIVGTEIKLTPEFEHAYIPKYSINSVNMPETYKITRKGSNESVTINASKYQNIEAVWKPTKRGTYTIELTMLDCQKQSSTYSIEYVIK